MSTQQDKITEQVSDLPCPKCGQGSPHESDLALREAQRRGYEEAVADLVEHTEHCRNQGRLSDALVLDIAVVFLKGKPREVLGG